MLTSLHIENFRGFRDFKMAGLGRVNLLVGSNNSGKSSVLEAIHLLAGVGEQRPIVSALIRRGEFYQDFEDAVFDFSHLRHGHQLRVGEGFAIAANTGEQRTSVAVTFAAADEKKTSRVRERRSRMLQEMPDVDEVLFVLHDLKLDWSGSNGASNLTLGSDGSIEVRDKTERVPSPIQLIPTAGLSSADISAAFNSVVLTPAEKTVYDALHIVEPGIEQLAVVGKSRPGGFWRGANNRGFLVKLAGQRVPLGSLGDGLTRLLGIALALVNARGGILLIDEIDTGLHYSVLVDMWKLVLETARRLDTQVFATTHSRDCYEALAAVTEAGRHDISLQRLERDRVEAIAFTEAELQVAEAANLEVR